MSLRFTVNGRSRSYDGPPFKRLIDVLREDLGLTGTKEGCGEGECGACTVLLDGEPVNSCLIPVSHAERHRVETVESLGAADALHPLQQAFLDHGGAQCGICTPGMLMSALACVRAEERDPATIRQRLAGNLCRCTGYQPIVDSVVAAMPGRRRGKNRRFPQRSVSSAATGRIHSERTRLTTSHAKRGRSSMRFPQRSVSSAATGRIHSERTRLTTSHAKRGRKRR
jgi:carbon-monoxide dehydrogenase small subunit